MNVTALDLHTVYATCIASAPLELQEMFCQLFSQTATHDNIPVVGQRICQLITERGSFRNLEMLTKDLASAKDFWKIFRKIAKGNKSDHIEHFIRCITTLQQRILNSVKANGKAIERLHVNDVNVFFTTPFHQPNDAELGFVARGVEQESVNLSNKLCSPRTSQAASSESHVKKVGTGALFANSTHTLQQHHAQELSFTQDAALPVLPALNQRHTTEPAAARQEAIAPAAPLPPPYTYAVLRAFSARWGLTVDEQDPDAYLKLLAKVVRWCSTTQSFPLITLVRDHLYYQNDHVKILNGKAAALKISYERKLAEQNPQPHERAQPLSYFVFLAASRRVENGRCYCKGESICTESCQTLEIIFEMSEKEVLDQINDVIRATFDTHDLREIGYIREEQKAFQNTQKEKLP